MNYTFTYALPLKESPSGEGRSVKNRSIIHWYDSETKDFGKNRYCFINVYHSVPDNRIESISKYNRRIHRYK
jgi:hypothetical protein